MRDIDQQPSAAMAGLDEHTSRADAGPKCSVAFCLDLKQRRSESSAVAVALARDLCSWVPIGLAAGSGAGLGERRKCSGK